MRSFLISAVLTIVAAPSVNAQYSSFPRTTEPAYWLSGGVGAFNGQGVNDGSTSSTWDFGQKTSWQYRGTIEKAIQNQSSIGVVGTFVHVPITYRYGGFIETPPCNTTSCSPSTTCSTCAAHLDMIGLMGQFHAGGGTGFHQVLEIAIGATAYRNLKRDSDGAALAPTGGNIDGSFALGYGFGYGFSSNSEVTLTQDYGLILHENTGLASGTSNTNTVRSIRAALRYGFGSQRPTVRRR
ncbi:MAG: hypothetical protein M3Z17_11630 [Gemmatimonadota bacterium]|nr:hypothetical protein [Gemmatimonadota bacterium]